MQWVAGGAKKGKCQNEFLQLADKAQESTLLVDTHSGSGTEGTVHSSMHNQYQ